MKKMGRLLTLAMVGCCVFMMGCTSGTDSTSDSGGGSNSAGVSGTVLVAESDLTQIGVNSNLASISSHISAADSIGIRNATQLPSGTGEIYLINSDGTVTYTGQSFTVTNGQFSITGLDPEKMYVVEIKAFGTSNDGQEKVIVLRAPVVFDETGQASVVVSETSKVVTDYFLSKVVAVGAAQIDSEVAQSLQEEIIDTYIEKLGAGDIQRVSPVVDADDVDESVAGVKKEWEMGNGELTIVEAVDDSDSVRKLKDQSVLESKTKGLQLSQGSIEDAKYVVRKIFGAEVSGVSQKDNNDNGPPEFFIQQFADAALRNVEVSILDFATALNDSLTNDQLKNTYWTVPVLESMMKHALVAPTLNVSILYQKYNGTSPNASVDAYMTAVFPKGKLLPISNLHSSQKLTVFQALYVIKQIGLVDGQGLSDEVMALMGDDGPPFDPYKLLNRIKFVQMSANQVYITESRVTPMTAYKPSGQNYELVPAIEAQVGIFGTNLGAVVKVVLEYPKSGGGVGVAELSRETQQPSQQSVGGVSIASVQKGISARIMETVSKGIREFNRSIRSENVDELAGATEQRWQISPWMNNGGAYIEDYVSGMATLKVLGAGNQVLATQQVRLIKFDASAISFISPQGMDMQAVEQFGWDQNFIPQVFPAENGKIRPLIAWNPPTYEGALPEGTMLAYSVNLGLSVIKIYMDRSFGAYPGVSDWDHEGNGYRYKNIWSSWQEGRYLVATSVQLKNELTSTVQNPVGNYAGSYEVNVAPLLVDKRTGQVVWQGKDSRTSFKVGNIPDWSVTLRGRVTFSSKISQMMPRDMNNNPIPGTWKIGLFKVGQSSNTGWTDLLFNTGSKQPVLKSNGVPIVATLGSPSDIQNNNGIVNYNLGSVDKGGVQKNSSYRLIVWYDVTETPNIPNWANRTAVLGSLDMATSTHLEFFDMGKGEFWVDQRGMRYSNHEDNTWLMLTDGNDEIDVTVGSWLK